MYFFPRKQEIIPFREFMAGNTTPIVNSGTVVYSVAPILIPTILGGVVKSTIVEKVAHAFDPLIQVVQGVAYPISFLSLSCGFIFISVGQRQRGVNLIKYSCLGFLGLQFAPAIMDILVTVAKEIADSL